MRFGNVDLYRRRFVVDRRFEDGVTPGGHDHLHGNGRRIDDERVGVTGLRVTGVLHGEVAGNQRKSESEEDYPHGAIVAGG